MDEQQVSATSYLVCGVRVHYATGAAVDRFVVAAVAAADAAAAAVTTAP